VVSSVQDEWLTGEGQRQRADGGGAHKGKRKTLFQLYWCFCTAPKGYVFDVQLKRPPARSFARFLTGTTKGQTAAKPGAGMGSYRLRARIRKKTGGKASGWSPILKVGVR
jgi:hypothetical protein